MEISVQNPTDGDTLDSNGAVSEPVPPPPPPPLAEDKFRVSGNFHFSVQSSIFERTIYNELHFALQF